MEVEVLIRDGVVVASADGPVYSPGYVAVSEGKIVDVGPGSPKNMTAQQIVDARNCIIIPGLISAHDHMYGVLAHGIPVKVAVQDFWDFLDKFWWPYVEDKLDKRLVEAAVRYAAVERLKTGTTTVSDILEAPNSLPGVLDVEARAVAEAGLRAFLSFEATERCGPENGLQGLKENMEFIRRRNFRDGIVKGMHCIHTTFTCSPDFIQQCRHDADETGAGIQIHFEEGIYETRVCLGRYGKYPAQLYEALGFWKDDVIASQCVKPTVDELEILARRGVKVSHQPLSNGEVGAGIAPIPEMVERGILVCLGTDGFITDMFEVMRNTWLIHKAAKENASVLSANQVFKMATENGATALNIKAGKIAPGYIADITILRNRFPTPLTAENVVTQIVVYATGNWVDTVLVDGKMVVSKGKVLTVDEDVVREECVKAATELWGESV
jgi:cytosine/adenosine deaminase-related metal-dependent hydrolase